MGSGQETIADFAYGALPTRLQPLLGSRAVAVAGLAACFVATIVTASLSLIDEFYLMRAAKKTSRGLARRRSMRHRASMLSQANAVATENAPDELSVNEGRDCVEAELLSPAAAGPVHGASVDESSAVSADAHLLADAASTSPDHASLSEMKKKAWPLPKLFRGGKKHKGD